MKSIAFALKMEFGGSHPEDHKEIHLISKRYARINITKFNLFDHCSIPKVDKEVQIILSGFVDPSCLCKGKTR